LQHLARAQMNGDRGAELRSRLLAEQMQQAIALTVHGTAVWQQRIGFQAEP
jgi:hypothetical protein